MSVTFPSTSTVSDVPAEFPRKGETGVWTALKNLGLAPEKLPELPRDRYALGLEIHWALYLLGVLPPRGGTEFAYRLRESKDVNFDLKEAVALHVRTLTAGAVDNPSLDRQQILLHALGRLGFRPVTEGAYDSLALATRFARAEGFYNARWDASGRIILALGGANKHLSAETLAASYRRFSEATGFPIPDASIESLPEVVLMRPYGGNAAYAVKFAPKGALRIDEAAKLEPPAFRQDTIVRNSPPLPETPKLAPAFGSPLYANRPGMKPYPSVSGGVDPADTNVAPTVTPPPAPLTNGLVTFSPLMAGIGAFLRP